MFEDKPIFKTKIFKIDYLIMFSAIFNLVFFIRAISKPVELPFILFTLILLITIHEFGHVFFCKIFKLKVDTVVIHFAGGLCIHEECNYSFQEILIAWGGVLAQFIALLLINFIYFLSVKVFHVYNTFFNIFFYIFIDYNIFSIIYNLLPLPGFDGSKAWSFISNYYKHKRDLKILSQSSHKKQIMKKNIYKKQIKKTKINITDEMKKEAKHFAENVLKDIKLKIDQK